jgi:hypothetical protein
MAATLVRKVMLKITADDGDTEEKIDRISLKADELAEKHPDLEVRIRTAEATAKLAVLRQELKDTAAEAAAVDAETAAGSGEGAESQLAEWLGENPALLAGVSALIPALEGAVVEVSALAGGFTAAGLGVGAMAALALPTFDKIKNGYSSVTAAQSAYHAAVQLEARDPTTTNAAAVATSLAKLRIAWHDLSPAARQGIRGIDGLKSSYQRMATAFQPDAMGLFNKGLRVANDLLPYLKPFADTAAKAVGGLVDKIKDVVAPAERAQKPLRGMSDSTVRLMGAVAGHQTPFQQFVAQLHAMEGPAITAIGKGLGNVASNLSRFVTALPPKDVVNGINLAFRLLSGTVRFMTFVVDSARTQWKTMTGELQLVERVTGDVTGFIGRAWHKVPESIKSAISEILQAIQGGTELMLGIVGGWPPKIQARLAGFGRLLWSSGTALIHGLVNGIESAVGGLLSTVGHLASEVSGAFSKVLSIFSPSKVFERHGVNIVLGLVRGITETGPQAVAASARLAASLSAPHAGPAGPGGGYGGGDIVLHLNVNEQQLMEWIRTGLLRLKRNKGFRPDTSNGLGIG